MPLRTIPIRRVGNRENLFMGCDRKLIMFTGLLTGILIFLAQEFSAALVGIFMWFVMLWILRKMAKSDAQMRFVYMRNRRYKSFYPPRSTPFRINTPGQGKQYK